MTKICNYCEEAKPATSEFFNKRKQSKDGFEYRCKTCVKARWKASKDGVEVLSAKSAKYEKEKSCGVRECDKCGQDKPFAEFYKNSGGGRMATIRQCKECHKETVREQRKSNKASNLEYHTIRENLNGARKRARENGYAFDITIEDLMPFPTHCEIFGTKLAYGEHDSTNGASIDKVIPSLGYIKGNVRIISARANFIKSDATVEELKKLINYMLK